ncbi:RloB domain-containing protein [Nonomuraea sp. NPDC049269]|uniref:RloB domain-containing protein n=1 Tax=Nonomuraea sp. NPDC049269 TaxID=3364349 RepID=UPI00371B77D5
MSPRTSRTRKGGIRTDTDLEHKKKGTRQERASFLILCEGKTEKDYFVGMRSRQGPHIDVDTPKVDHLSIVREAVARRSDEYDAVWCVLDTELDEVLRRR